MTTGERGSRCAMHACRATLGSTEGAIVYHAPADPAICGGVRLRLCAGCYARFRLSLERFLREDHGQGE